MSASAALSGLGARADIDGAIVLSTCNRFEVYLDSELRDVVPAVAEAAGLDVEPLREHASVFQGEDAARHLFSVASGLESVVVGEEEISGQVGRALRAARSSGGASSSLERLFQAAAKTSRGVKANTSLGAAGRSLVRLALELTASRFGDWSGMRVLLVGTGRYAATAVAALRERGATSITVFSPTGRETAFAASHGLRAAGDLRAELADADLVVTCTSHEPYVIAAVDLDGTHRTFIIDLGLPRNVNPDVTAVAGVELLDLETISLHAPLEELSSTQDARDIVGAAASAFAVEAAIAPAVIALREHVLAVLSAELERRRASTETEAALRHFVGVLLHAPSVRARELAVSGRSEKFLAALDALFDIRLDAEQPAADAAECA